MAGALAGVALALAAPEVVRATEVTAPAGANGDRPRPDGGVGIPLGTRAADPPPIQEAPSAPLAPGSPALAPTSSGQNGNAGANGKSRSDAPPPVVPLDDKTTQSPLPPPPDKTTAPRGEVPLSDPNPPKGGGATRIQDIKPNPVEDEVRPRATPDRDPRRTP